MPTESALDWFGRAIRVGQLWHISPFTWDPKKRRLKLNPNKKAQVLWKIHAIIAIGYHVGMACSFYYSVNHNGEALYKQLLTIFGFHLGLASLVCSLNSIKRSREIVVCI